MKIIFSDTFYTLELCIFPHCGINKGLSSFLPMFPPRNLVPVTQLYVSVDASTKDSLKKIDRPLFKDFWPRFLDSLKALGEKVSRLEMRHSGVKMAKHHVY